MKREVEEGVPIARVARKYGISRQSVYNVLKGPAEVPAEPVRGSKLDPFKPYVLERLDRFDLPATVLLLELRERGFDGGITILKDFVREVKGAAVGRVIERFETEPGWQAQVDWGECGTIIDGGVSRRLYAFVFVLGYSRMPFARFTTSTKQPVFLSCLRSAFERLGVPRELLIDNMKTAVDRPSMGEGARFNARFLDFCEHYGVLPVACPPYLPRVKGKVETGVKYLKRSFLTGRAFATLEDLNAQLEHWIDTVASVRVHGTTGERPIDRYAREVGILRPAAAVPAFETRELLIRKVHPDSHVRLAGGAYSVPPELVGSSVHVRIDQIAQGRSFEVLQGGRVVAQHVIAEPRSRVTLSEHEAAIRAAARHARRPQRAKARYEQRPIVCGPFARYSAPLVQARSLSEYERLLEPS